MTSIGFSEILLIMAMVLIFFGSKELPKIVKEIAKIITQFRSYSDKIKQEFNSATQQIESHISGAGPSFTAQKTELRKKYCATRDALTTDLQSAHSHAISDHVCGMDHIKNARSIMVYVSMRSEVQTHGLITRLLADNKRIIVPFCKEGTHDLGIAEITDMSKDLAPGSFDIPEPLPALRNNFFKSDIQVVLCPGVAFDTYGGRLGHGKGYFDAFLWDLKGKIPIIGLAYECQILAEPLPFGYHDIPMDQIVTEKGLVLARKQ